MPNFGGGRPPKLDEDQRERLLELLRDGQPWKKQEIQHLINEVSGHPETGQLRAPRTGVLTGTQKGWLLRIPEKWVAKGTKQEGKSGHRDQRQLRAPGENPLEAPTHGTCRHLTSMAGVGTATFGCYGHRDQRSPPAPRIAVFVGTRPAGEPRHRDWRWLRAPARWCWSAPATRLRACLGTGQLSAPSTHERLC